MNAVVKQEHGAVTVSSEAAALIQVISKAAGDPSVDVNKLERLMAMHERITEREAEKAFNVSMSACQAEMKQISADATNPQTRSKYATYAKLDSELRPVYTRHGFALSFDEGESKPEMVRVVCIVSHIGGHSRTYHRDMPADGKGAKGGDVMTKTHAAGAAGSYGARYLLKGIFNVAIGEHDDDGNGAAGGGNGKRLDENAYADHLAAIDAAADEGALKKAFGAAWSAAEKINDISAMRKFGDRKESRKKALGVK
jgi:hypothetical protein